MKKQFKKVMVTVGLAAAVLASAVSPVSAATGWQTIGQDGINYYYYNYDDNRKSGGVYTAVDGGSVGIQVLSDTKVTRSNGYTPVMQVQVYEDDGASYLDDHIGTFYYYPNSQGTVLKTFNAGAYADGANGKAEIQVVYTSNFQGTSWTKILD